MSELVGSFFPHIEIIPAGIRDYEGLARPGGARRGVLGAALGAALGRGEDDAPGAVEPPGSRASSLVPRDVVGDAADDNAGRVASDRRHGRRRRCCRCPASRIIAPIPRMSSRTTSAAATIRAGTM